LVAILESSRGAGDVLPCKILIGSLTDREHARNEW